MWGISSSLLMGAAVLRLAAAATVTTTFLNANQYQFDTDGNAIDLTSGKIDKIGDAYVWYGMAMGCGEVFCGITSYSSPDLQTWQYNGYLFDPTTPDVVAACFGDLSGNCGRPHIVYSAVNQQYVLWVNSYSPGYLVFTSSSPTSGYVMDPNRALLGYDPAGPYQGGDFSVQTINGTGYVAYSLIDFTTTGASIWPPFYQSIYFQQLTPDMKNTTGTATLVASKAFDLVDKEAESPDIFYRDGYFYITASNTCDFCIGTLLLVYRSKKITGPWTRQIISADTCGGQSTGVLTLPSPTGGENTYLHVADLFNTSPLSGIRTGAHGHQIQELAFHTDGSLYGLDCSTKISANATFTAGNVTTSGRALSATDSSGQDGAFTPICDIPYNSLYQTWESSKTGTLTEVGVNIAGDLPSQNTTITIFRYTNNTDFFTPRYVWTTLATAVFTPAEISTAFEVLRIPVSAAVTAGDRLGMAIVSTSVTPLCRFSKTDTSLAYNVNTSTRTLFALAPGQYSLRGPDGDVPPVVVLANEELKWYAIVS